MMLLLNSLNYTNLKGMNLSSCWFTGRLITNNYYSFGTSTQYMINMFSNETPQLPSSDY